jgi:hypothetical protein
MMYCFIFCFICNVMCLDPRRIAAALAEANRCHIYYCNALYCSSCDSLTCYHSPSTLSLSLCVCVIVWAESGVLESE